MAAGSWSCGRPGEPQCGLPGLPAPLTHDGESVQSWLDGAGDGAGEQMDHGPSGELDER